MGTMSCAELTTISAWVHTGKDPDEEEDDLKPSKPDPNQPQPNRRDHPWQMHKTMNETYTFGDSMLEKNGIIEKIRECIIHYRNNEYPVASEELDKLEISSRRRIFASDLSFPCAY